MVMDLREMRTQLGDKLNLRVTPNASARRIQLQHQLDGTCLIRIYVTVPPEDGKANREVLEVLSKALGVPRSALHITQGLSSRDKTVHITHTLS